MSLISNTYIHRRLFGPSFLDGEEFKYESIRLGTFEKWSAYDKASPIKLAQAGFYYTGNDDIVKCYVCQATKGHWSLDMVADGVHKNLNPSCAFYRENESLNVPISFPEQAQCDVLLERLRQQFFGPDSPQLLQSARILAAVPDENMYGIPTETSVPIISSDCGAPETMYQRPVHDSLSEAAPTREEFAPMKHEVARFKSYDSKWPRNFKPEPRDLARSGFYFTGTSDRVQCAFCRGILRNWDEDDVPSEEHRKHFVTCRFVMGIECGNVPDPNTVISDLQSGALKVTQPGAVNSDASLGIVTEQAKHPNYAVETARLNTFRNWPVGKEQTPELLAKAGFYFAGFGDSVKCFFCDGGLRTWENGDDPWTEHARWFPRCPYVRQVKGEPFIQDALLGRENGASVVARCKTDASSTSVKVKRLVEPREVSARMDSPMVQTVLTMGIPKERVSKAIHKQLQETGDDFHSVEALTDAIFLLEEEEAALGGAVVSGLTGGADIVETSDFKMDVKNDSAKTSEEANSSDDEDSQSLMEENRQLKEQRLCKICMDEEVNVVFLPCGHLVCCASCAPALRKCPICRANIKGTVRTFMS